MNTTREVSQWKGSIINAALVANEIFNRYGKEAAQAYDPELNCFTYRGWEQRGYQVKRGEKGIPVVTWITSEKENDKGEKETKFKFPKTSYVFSIQQVDKKEVR